MDFATPKVVVSKCLGFDSCRYNGQKIFDPVVQLLSGHVEFITTCPEVEIGLGVPRNPVRIVRENDKTILFQPASGNEVTGQMESYRDRFFPEIGTVDGFLLKSRSPSCGPWQVKVYSSKNAQSAQAKGAGIFGGYIVERFEGYPVEDEGRLKNFVLREHYFTSLFTLAKFRELKEQQQMRQLVDFHTKGKLLFMAYNQDLLHKMGSLAANHQQLPSGEVLEQYEQLLRTLFAEPPKFTNMINAFQHAFGGLSAQLQLKERQFFLNSLEEYRDERIPASTLIHLLKSWAIRFENQYLLDQYLMGPYPHQLIEITDSGKGRPL
ncbi:MAG: YbgA family protein [Spirochaetia bacterium]